jgi:hypothetical protein
MDQEKIEIKTTPTSSWQEIVQEDIKNYYKIEYSIITLYTVYSLNLNTLIYLIIQS